MKSTRQAESITTPEPSRDEPRFCRVRASGSMKVFTPTTAAARSSSEVCARVGGELVGRAAPGRVAAPRRDKLLPAINRTAMNVPKAQHKDASQVQRQYA